jgi:adenylate kinase
LLIVLTGVPGVGKSTVAELLASRLEGVHIDLSILTEKAGLITGWDEDRRTSIADLERIKQRLTRTIDVSNKPLIVEGHFASDVVPKDEPSFIFVLRKAPWKLKEDLKSRGYEEEKVRENVEAELLDVCLVDSLETYGAERVCEIDVTNHTKDEVVGEILSIIEGEAECCRGHVDWLGKKESKKLLES